MKDFDGRVWVLGGGAKPHGILRARSIVQYRLGKLRTRSLFGDTTLELCLDGQPTEDDASVSMGGRKRGEKM